MGKRKKKQSNFILQGSILAIAGIIVRIIGLVYRIPLTDILGDEGNSYYAAAFEVYSIMLLISSYSLPVAVSKLVSARVAKGQFKNARKFYHGAMIFAMISGGISSLIIFFFADFIAGTMMMEPMSSMALRVLSPAIFLFAIMGVIRGYFQGLGTMIPTAISQVIEQIVKAVTAIFGAKLFMDYGKKVAAIVRNDSYGAAYGAAGGTIGTVPAVLASLLFLLFVFITYRRVLKRQMAKDRTRNLETYSKIFKLILFTILPVILSTAVYNVSSVLDQGIYNWVVTIKGLEELKTSYGIYSGKYKVLINVPIALANAMCSSIVPTLSACLVRGNKKAAKQKVSHTMRFTMLIAIPCAMGLTVMGGPIIRLLFSTGDLEMPAKLLQKGSVAVIFYGISTLTNGVLQGINKMNVPVGNAAISLVLHVIALYVMLYYFNWGIYSVVISNILFALFMCIFNGIAIRKYMRYRQEVVRTFLIPILSSMIMGGALLGINKLMDLAFKTKGRDMGTLITIGIGAVVYFISLLLLKGIKESELRSFPKGNVLVAVVKKLHLL